MKISRHFTYEQCIKSDSAIRLGISNVPNATQVDAMILLSEKVLDVVKDKFPNCFITSFFRSTKANQAVGGGATSQHCKGEAVDIDSVSSNRDIFLFIHENLDFDQLLWEYGNTLQPAWVHVSFKATGNRRQVLRVQKSKGKTVYTPWN